LIGLRVAYAALATDRQTDRKTTIVIT